MNSVATPLLKWAGGKRRYMKEIVPVIEEHLAGRYFEPFLGGGALALHFGLDGMVVNDAIAEAVIMYRAVRDNPGQVAFELSGIACAGVDAENFYRWRDVDPATLTSTMVAARMIFLNKLGFNGVYRVNHKGKFNVPYAKAPFRPSIVGRSSRDAITSLFPNKEKFHDVARALRTAHIYHGDFEPIIDLAGLGDVVYCDPPYDDMFNGYTPGWDDVRDQPRLALAIWRACLRGATVAVSNSGTDRVRDLYAWADIRETRETRTINSDTNKRGVKASCFLIVCRPEHAAARR